MSIVSSFLPLLYKMNEDKDHEGQFIPGAGCNLIDGGEARLRTLTCKNKE